MIIHTRKRDRLILSVTTALNYFQRVDINSRLVIHSHFLANFPSEFKISIRQNNIHI